tara:strand:+ start:511 stop:774 length:264 start_codon:yes stop_codon:yes gene_type:complete
MKNTQEEPRLNVFLAHSGLCSRRMADELIKQGEITINHGVVKTPSYKVRQKDAVRYKKRIVKPVAFLFLGFLSLMPIIVKKFNQRLI